MPPPKLTLFRTTYSLSAGPNRRVTTSQPNCYRLSPNTPPRLHTLTENEDVLPGDLRLNSRDTVEKFVVFAASLAVVAFFLWFGVRYFRATERTFADIV